MRKYPKTGSFWLSLGQASRGLRYACKTQNHLQFHLLAGTCALAAAWWCRLPRIEWVLLILTVASVITAEVVNTAIELVVDLVQPNFDPLAGMVKDVSAGAVLVTAIQSVIVGLFIFGPPLWHWIRYVLV